MQALPLTRVRAPDQRMIAEAEAVADRRQAQEACHT
jgi:hypothetical protein